MTKQAIEEFQKVNNLAVDGKVGPKTWGALSKYLSAPAVSGTTQGKE
jgi:lysozyme family protein